MKTVHLIFSFLFLSIFSLTVFGQPQPDKVALVTAGQLKEARVSWWGFDAADSTKFLQAAIDSKVPKLIVDAMPTPWITESLHCTDDQEIVFERACVVEAKRGAFKGKTDSLLNIVLKKNVSIRSENGATLRMWIADYHSEAYEQAEWRHGINIKSSENVIVQNLSIIDSGGDGIYLGVAKRGIPCKNIVIRDVVCDNNNRQGISVISAEKLLIENTVMKNTKGTAPRAGIDFEPNHPSEVLIDCVMKNCVTENNGGDGYEFYLPNLNRSSKPVSIRLENCVSKNDARYGFMFITGNGENDAVSGTVEVVDCRFERSGGNGLGVQGNPASGGCSLKFKNLLLRELAEKPETSMLRFAARNENEFPIGNIRFESVRVIGSPEDRFFEFKDASGNGLGLENVSGTIFLEQDGQKTIHRIDPEWISKRFPPSSIKRFPKYDYGNTRFEPLQTVSPDTDRTLPLLRSRNGIELLFHAEKGMPLRFALHQGQVARYAGKAEKVRLLSPSGKSIPLPDLKFKEDTEYRIDAAPESGVYRLHATVGSHWVALKKSNRPVALAAVPKSAHLISTQGEFYFLVPEGAGEFGVRIRGDQGERVKVTLFDPSGKQAWTANDIEEIVGFEATAPGVWKIKFERPEHGVLEDFYVSLAGIPPLLGFTPELLLQTSP